MRSFQSQLLPEYLVNSLHKYLATLSRVFERWNECWKRSTCGRLSGNGFNFSLIEHHHYQRPPTQTMAPINPRRYGTYTHEVPPTPYVFSSGHTLQQHTGLFPDYCSVVPHSSVISSDPQTFPILPGQLEKHLEQARQCLTHTQATPASGSAPLPTSDQILVLNPSAGMTPTVHAFHAPALGMPPMSEYLRFLTRYLNEMAPNKRGKALIDLKLMGRIKLILAIQREGFSSSDETSSDSDLVPPTSYGTGGSWDTQAFRRWVRKNFVYRLATYGELERAVDFGLLSPPNHSLSGPGVPGHPPSTSLSHPMNLVFHKDRPVALRSSIYRIILRAHWITNHAGRDRTWAMVREVCSYIPKCLVYDFVAACPTCRVARARQYEIRSGILRDESSVDTKKIEERSQHEFQTETDTDEVSVGGGLPPILPVSSYNAPPVGWIPPIDVNNFPYSCPTPMSTYPLWQHQIHHEMNAEIVNSTPDLSTSPLGLPPLLAQYPPVTSITSQAADHLQHLNPLRRDLQGARQEVLGIERGSSSCAAVSKLIEVRVEQTEHVNVLTSLPVLKRKVGPSTSESIEYGRVGVGREVMVNTSDNLSSKTCLFEMLGVHPSRTDSSKQQRYEHEDRLIVIPPSHH